jgi:hypothetical protein
LWLKANEKVKITKMRQSQAEPGRARQSQKVKIRTVLL